MDVFKENKSPCITIRGFHEVFINLTSKHGGSGTKKWDELFHFSQLEFRLMDLTPLSIFCFRLCFGQETAMAEMPL